MKARRIAAAVLLAALVCLAAGCATARRFTPVARLPLGLTPQSPIRTYRVGVSYTNQDDIGTPLDVVEIRATVRIGSYGTDVYVQWESYEHRQYRIGGAPPAWEPFRPAIGFDYLMTPVAREPDYIKNLPNVDSISRDLTGLYFYINLIDLHMWDLYTCLFLRTPELFPAIPAKPLRAIGDTMLVDLTGLPIALVEWENVSSDLTMTGGTIRAEYLGSGVVGGVRTKIISFEQEQTIRQNVYGIGLKMPYQGTNRFLGHMHLDEDNQLVLASYSEFVYSKIKAPMSQTVIVHSQRDYRIELLSAE
jgi:hypothetical protein